MKTFIFLLILVIGFFFFLFSGESQNREKVDDNITSLEMLENRENILSQHEVQEYTSLVKDAPKEIPQEQAFDTIVNIIKEARGDIYTPNITLNTRLSSLLYTADAKEQFKNSLASAYNLTYDQVDKLYKENKLVWDFVNKLK